MTAHLSRPRSTARRAVVVAAALGAAATLSACSAPRPGAAATVGNGRIEISDLASRVEALKAIPTLKSDSTVTLQRNVLSELITERVDDQVAKQAGITVTPAEVEAAIDTYMTSTGAKTQAQVQAALLSPTGPDGSAETPAGYSGVESYVRDSVLLNKLRTAFAAKLPITDAGLRAIYAADPTAFNSANLSVIVLTDPAKANADYAKIAANPAIFGDVAKIDSLSTQSAQSGGEVGDVPEGQLGPDIDPQVFASKAGSVLKPISEQGAYIIIKVNSLTIKDFDQARSDLVTEAKSPSGAPTVSAIGQQRRAAAAKLGVWVNPRFGSWAGAKSIPASGASVASVLAPDNPLATNPGTTATSP